MAVFEELYIAEKPSVARAIADNLGGPVQTVRGRDNRPTHYVVGNKVVTNVFGHILELMEPEDYNSAFAPPWVNSASLLPMIPPQFKLKPVKEAKAQLDVIATLLKQCKVVVHAGDSDREGQVLVQEVLEYLGNTAPVKRILPNAIDNKSMQKILANVVDNSLYQGLYRAGLARRQADWLIGVNGTRALTIANERSGLRGIISVGRVQTPTLAMIVRRDLEIENFKPQIYFDLSATFKHAKGMYTGDWVVPKGLQGLDREGRLLDATVAAGIKADCEGKPAAVVEYKVEDHQQSPTLPFSLSALQKKASELYKMGAKKVLEICQALYEKKLTSYPRTDTRHLPEDQWGDARDVLAAVAKFDASLATLVAGANPALKSPAWNSKQCPTHHGIVPTADANYASLTEPERKVFMLIARQFIAQFYPDYRYRQTTIVTRCGSHDFRSNGRTPIDLGWRRVLGAQDDAKAKKGADKPEQTLPPMAQGDAVGCLKLGAEKKQTKAPPRFTEGSVIHAMTNVHEEVSDPEHKKKLREVKGLGTEATRGDMIETIKKRMFVSPDIEEGCLVSTPAGRALIQALPKELTDVTLTALWENATDQIDRGVMTLERFMEGQVQWCRKLTRIMLESKVSIAVGLRNESAARTATERAGQTCPECGRGILSLKEAKQGQNKGKLFLSCTNFRSDTPCRYTEDIDGQEDPVRRGSRRGGGSSGRKN